MSEKHAMSGLMELVDWLGKFQPRCDDWEQVPIEIDGKTFDGILCGFACEIDDISLRITQLEEENARLRPDPSMGLVGVQLTPAEYAELVSLTPDGMQVSTFASNLVRSSLPGTEERVLAAARGED